jgi:hypothetical protein
MASNNLQNKFIQNYGIEILKRREKYRWIRGNYPDTLGQYVGFMPGRLG